MIEIDIKILPYSQRDKSDILKRIQISNDGTRDVGKKVHHYTAEVLDPNGNVSIEIPKFQHERANGSLGLLYKALQKHFEKNS